MRSVFAFQLALGWGVLLVTLGCGKNQSGNIIADGSFTSLVAGTLQTTSAQVTGTGVLLANAPLSQIGSKNSFRLSFSLNDNGTLDLIANGSDTLADGFRVRFTRSGTTLKVFLGTASRALTEVSQKFPASEVNASQALTFQIDVHNDETPAHVVIWDGDKTSFFEATARLNSEDVALAATDKGQGQRWGLALTEATVTAATPSSAKYVE